MAATTPRAALPIGRRVLRCERASANYRLRLVKRRRTGEETWEVLEAATGSTVAVGLVDRDEALRMVKGFERLSQERDEGLPDHIQVH